MLKKILFIGGILIVGIASFSLLNKPLEVDTAVASNEELETVTKEELQTLKTVTKKIHEKYEELEFVVSSNSEIELNIKINENEENFNLVKKDIESIAESVIISSTLKNYRVVVERLDLSFVTEEGKNSHKELQHLSKTLMEGLKEYELIGNIGTHYQKSITIHTSIKGSDNDAHKLAMEIEKTVNEILHSKELNSISHIDSYEINILNNNGKVVD